MDKKVIRNKIREYIYRQFQEDVTGHGIDHMERVAYWSAFLAKKEGIDPFIAEVCGWMHDIGDSKLFHHPEDKQTEGMVFLQSLGFSESTVSAVKNAIDSVSYRKGITPESKLGQVVQDADRLDAIGAIGIARTFAFGGAKGQLLQSKNRNEPTSIGHFYDKLLKLAGLMNTESGKQEAKRRHSFMLTYLNEFHREQNVTELQEEFLYEQE